MKLGIEQRKYLIAHQEPDIYLSVCSKRDVICLRLTPEEMELSVNMRWDYLLPRLLFFSLPYASDINIALEFDDSWIEGLDNTRDTILEGLREPSQRSLAMRAHWAWMMGEIPRLARMWLIDRGDRLPAHYRLPEGREAEDGRYKFEMFSKYPCKPEKHHFFIDGKNRYVESYSWAGQPAHFNSRQPSYGVPLLLFMWTMKWFCLPPAPYWHQNMLIEPMNHSEDFFRVLCQLPGTGGTG